MPSTFHFNQTQLQVIQAMQARVDRAVAEAEHSPNSPPSATKVLDSLSDDWLTWKQCDHLQSKLIADCHDHKIPLWAVPDVRATWLARRNRLGRGGYSMYPNLSSLFG